MYERHVPGPFLVVVPLSTIAARVREVLRWLPEMNVVRYTGDASSRGMIRQYEFDRFEYLNRRATASSSIFL
jgi:chromodomain-helicase-DNA-binding protein 1